MEEPNGKPARTGDRIMLSIYFGDMPEAVYNTSVFFDNQYLDDWITDDFSRAVIKAIDKGEVISSNAVDPEISADGKG